MAKKEFSVNTSGGIGTFGLLGVLFVGLKLGGVISWSWWLVTLPFWGGFIVLVAILVLAFIFVGILQWIGGDK